MTLSLQRAAQSRYPLGNDLMLSIHGHAAVRMENDIPNIEHSHSFAWNVNAEHQAMDCYGAVQIVNVCARIRPIGDSLTPGR